MGRCGLQNGKINKEFIVKGFEDTQVVIDTSNQVNITFSTRKPKLNLMLINKFINYDKPTLSKISTLSRNN